MKSVSVDPAGNLFGCEIDAKAVVHIERIPSHANRCFMTLPGKLELTLRWTYPDQ